jgi:thiamine biosynthesis lipoprotein
LYSIYHRFDGIENLCTVNETVNGAHRTVTVDKRIIDMLIYAKEMHEKTNGVMNIAMGSVLSLWHNYRTVGKDNPNEAALPPMEELKTASQHTDISNLIIDEVNNTVTLTDPLMTLDVGAIAKGYAVERVALFIHRRNSSLSSLFPVYDQTVYVIIRWAISPTSYRPITTWIPF